MNHQKLHNLSLVAKTSLSKRLKRQALLLLFIALGSLFYGLLCEPHNALWAFPLVIGYLGGSMASATSRRLIQLINESYGSVEEEYF